MINFLTCSFIDYNFDFDYICFHCFDHDTTSLSNNQDMLF